MAFGGWGHSPLASYADGLGILPSAESLDHRSVYSLAFTGSTGTISSSISQNTEQDGTRGRSRTKTMRTKEIEKSPLPHRFHLVPSRKTRPSDQTSVSPRPTKQWKYVERPETESVYSAKSPSVYETNTHFHSSEPVTHDRDEFKRTIIEDLVSDALQSPVFESFRPRAADIEPDHPSSPHATSCSFTLVHDQSSRYKRFSSTSKSIREPSPDAESIHTQALREEHEYPVSVDRVCGSEDEDALTSERIVHTKFDAVDVCMSPITHSSSAEPAVSPSNLVSDYEPLPHSAQPSESVTTLGLLDSSFSQYSVHFDSWVTSSAHHDHPTSHSTRSLNRRATDGSYVSLNYPPTGDRRFAHRRQAIYAEYGFKIAFPDSDSESSIRNHQTVQSSHHSLGSKPKPQSKLKGHTGRAASAYAFSASAPRSVWSTSTSDASLKSVLEPYARTAVDDFCPDLPYPPSYDSGSGSGSGSGVTLNLAQADDKLERLSVQDDLPASNQNQLLDVLVRPKTNRPLPAKSRSQRSLAQASRSGYSPSGSAAIVTDGLAEEGCLPTRPGGESGSARRPCQWVPLQVLKQDSTDPLVLCVHVSPSDRAERFALWRDDPGHHPIVEALLKEVDRAVGEWRRLAPSGFVVAYV